MLKKFNIRKPYDGRKEVGKKVISAWKKLSQTVHSYIFVFFLGRK